MNDITTCCTCARPVRPVRRIKPKPAPLLLRPEWRVDAPASVTVAAARAGRIRALEAKAQRKAEAFQPVDTVLLNDEFAARVAEIQARRGATLVCARPVAAPMPMAAG